MKVKIPVKSIYLIMIISLGLIGLGVGSTYAMFTANAEINNPISIASNLNYSSDLAQVVDVTVAPGQMEEYTLNVSNSTSRNLNIAVWYFCESSEIILGSSVNSSGLTFNGNTLIGTISASTSNAPITVYVRNKSNRVVNVTLGVSGFDSNVVLADNFNIVPASLIRTITLKRNFDGEVTTYGDLLAINNGGSLTNISIEGPDNHSYTGINCTNNFNPSVVSIVQPTSQVIRATATFNFNNVTSDLTCTVSFN